MIKQLLSNRSLIEKVLTEEEILSLASKKGDINIMMGQTFDSGQPVEMLKYALFIMNLSEALSKEGAEVHSNWLIADHFMTEINGDKERNEALRQAEDRINYLDCINSTYGGDIGFLLSSELSRKEAYQEKLALLKRKAQEDESFREKALEAIPKDRRSNPEAINYPLEELATIESMDTDIKIGPKYEVKYDVPARVFVQMTGFKKFSAIHLRNGYPFGNPSLNADKSAEIEEYGLLPYKITSKGLQEFRIDPINKSRERNIELLLKTADKRALIDVIETCKLASMKLRRKFNYTYPEELEELRSLSVEVYSKYIGEYMVCTQGTYVLGYRKLVLC